jgi:hypothetical protein
MGADWVHTNLGVTRRELIKRGAVVGGTVVWAAPVIQSLSSPAFAGSTTETLAGLSLSTVGLLLESGGVKYRVKFEASGFSTTGAFGPTECGRKFKTEPCANKLGFGDPAVAQGCPAGVSATFSKATGQLSVALGTCKLLSFVAKCGVPADPDDAGCEDPGEGVQPSRAIGQVGGTVVFQPCTPGNDPGFII